MEVTENLEETADTTYHIIEKSPLSKYYKKVVEEKWKEKKRW